MVLPVILMKWVKNCYEMQFTVSIKILSQRQFASQYQLCELRQIPPRILYAKLHFPLTEFALALYFFLVLLSLCNLSKTYYSTHSVACIFNYTLKTESHTNSIFVMVDFVLFFTCLFVFNF